MYALLRYRASGGTGRRTGLKNLRPSGHEGSIPSSPKKYLGAEMSAPFYFALLCIITLEIKHHKLAYLGDNNMETVLIICAIVATLAFTGLMVQAIITLRQITNAGKAVEYLALNADSKLTALDPVVDSCKNVSSMINNAWFKTAGLVYGLVSRFRK